MIMLLYNMKFRIVLFDMIEPSPCVMFFPMYFLVSAQKTEANFQILQLNLYFDHWRHKETITFSAVAGL